MKEYKKMLEDLYNGKIKPSQDEIKSEEYAIIRKESIELSNKILNCLNNQNKKIYNKYIELQSQSQLQSIDSEIQFIKGFSLAVKLILGSLEI